MSLLKLNNGLLLVCLLVIIFANEVMSKGNPIVLQTTVQADSLKLPALKKHIGRKLERLIFEINSNKHEKYYLDEPPGSLVGVIIKFESHQVALHVYLKKLKHVEMVNKERNWSWEQIEKERINLIEVYKGSELIETFQ